MMKKCYFFILFCLTKNFILSALITCSPEPIASCSPFESVLHTWPRSYLEYVGNRMRVSTCTGVIWVGNHKLLSVGVHNLSLDTYAFDPTVPSLVACKSESLKNFQQTVLGQLENITITKDGSLAAVSNNGAAAVHLYKIINAELKHLTEIPKVGWWNHGVRFSQEMDYLCYTLFGNPGKIRLFRILNEENEIYLEHSHDIDTGLFPLQPKGIDFSLDDRFIVVCHAINNTNAPNRMSGAITVYPFDKMTGTINQTPVSFVETSLLCVPEDLCFSPDGSCILVTNHGNDTVTLHPFDQETGNILEGIILLQNPEAQLSFPHAISISPDGNYLAVTNYGDDAVKIYRLTNY